MYNFRVHPGRMPLVTIVLFGLLPSAAAARPITLGAGFDYADGIAGEFTRTARILGSGEMRGIGLSAAGARYEDNRIGLGAAVFLGCALPFGSNAQWRIGGGRYFGEQGFRATYLKIGPTWTASTDDSFGAFFTSWDDRLGGHSRGLVAEVGHPIVSGLRAQLGGGWATTSSEAHATQATFGLTWKPLDAFELSGDLGFARNGVPGSDHAPSGPARQPLGLPLPLLGGDSDSRPQRPGELTFLLGAHVFIP